MKLFFAAGLAVLTLVNSASADEAAAPTITTATEQRAWIERLSGVQSLGIGGLPGMLPQRFSDSPYAGTAADFLVAEYGASGIAARVMPFDPMDVYPDYLAGTERTYRGYLEHLRPQLETEFNAYCDGSASDELREKVQKRLDRAELKREVLCAAASTDRFETYLRATVERSTRATRELLEKRSMPTWPNVVAWIPTAPEGSSGGEAGPRPACVIGAHLDSVARENGGRGPIVSPGVVAPGADDNASGTAAVITLARALRDWREREHPALPCDLVFVHFTGEEEGLFGSLAWIHRQWDGPVLWMVNFDMIAYRPQGAGSHEPRLNLGYNARFGSWLAQAFGSGASRGPVKAVTVESADFVYSSDQISFWDAGVPALSISEEACSDAKCANPYTAFNPFLHTPEDLASHLDFDYAAGIVNQSFLGVKAALGSNPR